MSVVPVDPGSAHEGGNTITPSKGTTKKQISPSKKWCFTYNNYEEGQLQSIIDIIDHIVPGNYIIGKEVGALGTPHLQGYIEFKSKLRPKCRFPYDGIHWEKARGSRKDNIEYCSKERNYVTNFKVDKPLLLIRKIDFYLWQLQLHMILTKDPDPRKIYWVWDEHGNIGKSAFAKYMCALHDCIVVGGKTQDIFNGIVNYKKVKEVYPEIIIIDCPRQHVNRINYGAIEQVKNGLFFSGKYEAEMLIFNSPHVVVFANSEPDIDQYSADRWCIRKLEDINSSILCYECCNDDICYESD